MSMKTSVLALIVALLSLASVGAKPEAAAEAADTVFKNGNIYTVNERQPHAEAVAVKGGKIIFVGSNRDVKPYEGKGTRVVDLKGNTVVPGLTDSHYHLAGVGAREVNLNLEGITSLEAFLAKVKERVDRAKPGEWVTGAAGSKLSGSPRCFLLVGTWTRFRQTTLSLWVAPTGTQQ